MKTKNIYGLTADELMKEADKGVRFIYYEFTISLFFVSFKRNSGVYLLEKGANAISKGLPFTMISLLFGWWAFPKGPKNTIESINTNRRGGKDVTDIVMQKAAGYIQFRESQKEKTMLHQFNS
jgi:hypothetical protein